MRPDDLPAKGICPRWLREEHRMQEIAAGIARYAAEFEPIPQEWIDEYNELARRMMGK